MTRQAGLSMSVGKKTCEYIDCVREEKKGERIENGGKEETEL